MNAEYYRAHPERTKARKVVADAVWNGLIKKSPCCEGCGRIALDCTLHAHHWDYSFPLWITWLCPPCHFLAPYDGWRAYFAIGDVPKDFADSLTKKA